MVGFGMATLSTIMRDKGDLAAAAEWSGKAFHAFLEVNDPASIATVASGAAELAAGGIGHANRPMNSE